MFWIYTRKFSQAFCWKKFINYTDFIFQGDRYKSYNDGDVDAAGTDNYALITDFELDRDAIALAGEKSNYSLVASPEGTNLYVNDGTSLELIVIIVGIEPDSFSADFKKYFAIDTEFIYLFTLKLERYCLVHT